MTLTLEGTLFAFESRCVLPQLASNARNSRNLWTLGGDIFLGGLDGSALSQSGLHLHDIDGGALSQSGFHPHDIGGQLHGRGWRRPDVERRLKSRTTRDGGYNSGARHCKQSSKDGEVVVG